MRTVRTSSFRFVFFNGSPDGPGCDMGLHLPPSYSVLVSPTRYSASVVGGHFSKTTRPTKPTHADQAKPNKRTSNPLHLAEDTWCSRLCPHPHNNFSGAPLELCTLTASLWKPVCLHRPPVGHNFFTGPGVDWSGDIFLFFLSKAFWCIPFPSPLTTV